MSQEVRNTQAQPFLPSTRSPVSSEITTGAARIDARMSATAGTMSTAASSIMDTR